MLFSKFSMFLAPKAHPKNNPKMTKISKFSAIYNNLNTSYVLRAKFDDDISFCKKVIEAKKTQKVPKK